KYILTHFARRRTTANVERLKLDFLLQIQGQEPPVLLLVLLLKESVKFLDAMLNADLKRRSWRENLTVKTTKALNILAALSESTG
ncbi:MAG: hypothetical protein Q9164_007644, partial [Protoblastenia rupestris]